MPDTAAAVVPIPTVRLIPDSHWPRVRALDPALPPPALLISYAYLQGWPRNRHVLPFRDWALDSGAFTAWRAGKVVEFDAYHAAAQELAETDPTLTDVFALDVIGNWRGGLANTQEHWRRGLKAIPTFHAGEPWDVLQGLAADFPKIALGGVVGYSRPKKRAWLTECFARVWPKPIHGLGIIDAALLLAFPFHSVDASSWSFGPAALGTWASVGGLNLGTSAKNLPLTAEVEHYLRLEQTAQARWRPEAALLATL